MSAAPLRTLLGTLFLLVCVVPASADSPEDTARRYLTRLYEGQFDALPKAAGAKTEAFEKNVRYILRVRTVKVESFDVKDVEVAENDAAVSLQLAIRKTERQPPHAFTATEAFPLRLKLVRENDQWLVSAVEFPDAELAETLIAAKTDEERKQLLESNKHRVTRSLARALYDRALALLNQGKMADGERAGVLAREVAAAAGDRAGIALAMGIEAFVRDGDKLKVTADALALAEGSDDPDVLARLWYNHGRAAPYDRSRGQGIPSRLELFRKAVVYAERAEDPRLLVRILSSAGLAATTQMDNVMARDYIDRALPVAREIGDSPGETNLEAALATIYNTQGDAARSMYHLTRALQIAERDGLYGYTTLVLRVAAALVSEERFDEADRMFRKVLYRGQDGAIKATGPLPADHLGAALVYWAEVESSRGRFDEAWCMLREAASKSGLDEATYLYLLSRHYLKRGDVASALASATASMDKTGLNPEERMQALGVAARAYHLAGQTERALATAVEALDLYDTVLGATAGGVQQRALAAERNETFFELAAEIEAARGNVADALAYLERARAMGLTEILEKGRPGALADADAANEEERLRRERELARLSVEVDQARAAGDQAALASRTERLREARAEHATWLDGVRARTERRYSSRRYFDGAGLTKRMQSLPPRMVAVEYMLREKELHIFAVRRNASGAPSFTYRKIDSPRTDVEKLANRFVDQLAKRDVNVPVAARELYELLIAPVESEIAAGDVVLLVPDGALWRVPFAALGDRHDRLFVERWASVYAPSITSYSMIADSKKEKQSRPATLFAVGNPKLDLASKSSVTSFYRDADLNPLPDAEREVDGVGNLYGSRHSVVLKRDEATEARTKAAVGNATVVHFATHALFDDANPMYSRLALARGDQATDDGWLESWEVAQLDLNADIVVLSACETARGRIGGGEGVMGMAWSFFVAGAHSTVATQWRVASNSTAELMVKFHRALRDDKQHDPAIVKAQALRGAQLHLLRDRRSRHPYYWAPFVLFGS
jgi:CHAT domain-containing protein